MSERKSVKSITKVQTTEVTYSSTLQTVTQTKQIKTTKVSISHTGSRGELNKFLEELNLSEEDEKQAEPQNKKQLKTAITPKTQRSSTIKKTPVANVRGRKATSNNEVGSAKNKKVNPPLPRGRRTVQTDNASPHSKLELPGSDSEEEFDLPSGASPHSVIEHPGSDSEEKFDLPSGASPHSVIEHPRSEEELDSPNVVNETDISSKQAKRKTHLKPGFAFILNHQKFDSDSQTYRDGSDKDVESLLKVFNNFKLTTTVLESPTFAMINNMVNKIAKMEFKRHSCLVIVVLSHGDRNERVHARDKTYSINDDIIFKIIENESLQKKPKIIFVQACKGAMEVCDFHRYDQKSYGRPTEILKFCSTYEGFVSYRTENGSFFIQTLCKFLMEKGKTECIEKITQNVTNAVIEETKSRQVPTKTSNLTKPFIFGDYMYNSKKENFHRNYCTKNLYLKLFYRFCFCCSSENSK